MADPPASLKIAMLALLGASAGVHLGWSAIAEIAPSQLAGKAPTASARPSNTPHRPVNPAFASPIPGEHRNRAVCVGCRTYPEEYRPVHDPAVEAGDQSGWTSNPDEASMRVASGLAETLVELARRHTAEDGDRHQGPPDAGAHSKPTGGTDHEETDDQAPEVNPI